MSAGRKQTTGGYDTRDQLEANVMALAGAGKTWRVIAKETGVTASTAFKIGRAVQARCEHQWRIVRPHVGNKFRCRICFLEEY